MTALPPELNQAPQPLLVVSEDGAIQDSNLAACAMGFILGQKIDAYLPQLEESFVREIADAPETKLWRFVFAESEKFCHVTLYRSANDRNLLWLQDMSEQLVLADRLRQLKDPSNKQLRQINHQSSTALGYAELLDVIMEDHEVLSAEKLSAVKQYQTEVRSSLQKIQQIAVQEMSESESDRNTILLVESHTALNELITELLRTEGYKVTSFHDGDSAMKFFSVNDHAIDIAIIDETQHCQDGTSLVSALRQVSADLSVITLSSNADASEHSIKKPVDFRQLLQAVQS